MKQLFLISMIIATLISCSKDEDPTIVLPPSEGSNMQLEGLDGNETGDNPGANANKSVFVDLSADKQTGALRSSWDLGFYCGSDYRVIINNNTQAIARVIDKTDLNAVSTSDTVDLQLTPSGFDSPSWPNDFSFYDDLSGDISKTVIPEISANESDNKVVIINPGTGGGVSARDYMKIRIIQNGSGYTLQYAKIAETTFKTIDIAKDDLYNFKHISFTSGAVVEVEPEKNNWDIVWGWALAKTNFTNNEVVPYGFSDLVFINKHAGVTALERIYSSQEAAAEAYTKFNKDSVDKYALSNDKWTIGSKWRVTVSLGGSSEPAGVRKNRFYIVKDATGNAYKLKFVSFIAQDDGGGTRGKPEIQYQLIK